MSTGYLNIKFENLVNLILATSKLQLWTFYRVLFFTLNTFYLGIHRQTRNFLRIIIIRRGLFGVPNSYFKKIGYFCI